MIKCITKEIDSKIGLVAFTELEKVKVINEVFVQADHFNEEDVFIGTSINQGVRLRRGQTIAFTKVAIESLFISGNGKVTVMIND